MSRYYNVYHSMKPKRGMWGAVIAVVLIAALVLSLAIAFWLVPWINRTRANNAAPPVSNNTGGNGGEEPAELIALSVPTGLALDSTMTRLSWSCEDSLDAVGYSVKINGNVIDVFSNPVTINLMEGIPSVISVKANGDNSVYSDSPWSEELTVTKENGLLIAYATILSSMSGILESKVLYGTQEITTGDIFAINALDNNTATVWYTFVCGDEEGLAVTTLSVPAFTGIVDYKNKIDQIAIVINDNNLTSEFFVSSLPDVSETMLARNDLGGSLNVLKQQGYTLMPICSYTSGATVVGGVATMTFRGILRAEKGSNVRYFSYHYTASMNEVSGFDSEDYINQMYGTAMAITFAEVSVTREISMLGKEMLSMYLLQQEA